MDTSVSAVDFASALRQSDELAAAGCWDDAIRLLTEANRNEENSDLERRLLKLRHLAFADVTESVPVPNWPKSVPDYFPEETSIPEIHASELCADVVTSAIMHHGSLMVRGMIDPDAAAGIRDAIDHAFESAAEVETPLTPLPPWYLPFRAHRKGHYSFGGPERTYAREGGGLHAVDAPRALFRHLDALSAVGFDRLLKDYFGESVALSAKKTTLRRTEPGALAGWHRDGAFLGTETRSLNIWTALSPCGVDAASLDILPRRLDTLVDMGGPDIFDWAVSNETAEKYAAKAVVRPVFDTGDALLFDQLTLHRTGVDSSMTKTRYAIEMWCFAASTYPHEQIPLCW
tara:strand:- start:3420 stop:4454 length:1035 start_codon:yes stop_codon:yes gene_type:complete